MELYISIISIIISVISVGVSIAIYCYGIRREKREATLEAFNVLQEKVFDRLNHYRKYDIDEIADDVRSPDYKDISGLLARCAHFAVGVNSGIYDFSTVRRLAGRYIISLYYKLEPLIEKKRKLNQSERHYEEFEQLAKKLEKYYK